MFALCAHRFRFSPDLTLRSNNIMPIKIRSRVVMKAKAAIKGTVLEATAKYTWDVKWDDGIVRAPYKSQQLKEWSDPPPPAPTDAPPAALDTMTHGKCHIFCGWLSSTFPTLMCLHCFLLLFYKAMQESI
jgi:hypothetical protein